MPVKTPAKKIPVKRSGPRPKISAPKNITEYTKEQLEKELHPAKIHFVKRLVARMGNQLRAYMDTFDSTEKTAGPLANRLLKDEKVRIYYKLLQQEIAMKDQIDAEYVVHQQKRIVESNILDFLDGSSKYWKVKSIKDIPKEMGWLIQEIVPTKEGIKIKLYDKQKALAELASFAGLHKSSGEGGTNINLVFDSVGEDV